MVAPRTRSTKKRFESSAQQGAGLSHLLGLELGFKNHFLGLLIKPKSDSFICFLEFGHLILT